MNQKGGTSGMAMISGFAISNSGCNLTMAHTKLAMHPVIFIFLYVSIFISPLVKKKKHSVVA